MTFLKRFTKGSSAKEPSRELWQRKWRNHPRWALGVLTLIFLLAAWLRFTGLVPNVIHPDEAYTEKVVGFLKQSGQANPKAFKYGALPFYLNLVAVKTVVPLLENVPIAPQPDYPNIGRPELKRIWLESWTMRGLTALLGALTVLVVYQLGVALFDRYTVGLAAAAFIAVSPLHTTNSHWVTTDVLATLLLYLALLFAVKLWRLGNEAKLKNFLIAGLLVGLAASVRYQPLGLVPYAAAFLLTWRFSWKRISWFIAGLAAAGAGFLIANPFLLAELPQVRHDFAVNILPWYKPKVAYWFANIIPVPPGFNWWYLKELARTGTGPTVAALALVGLAIGFVRRLPATLLVLSASVPVVIVVAGYLGPTWDRLVIPAIPGLALLGAFGLVESLQLVGGTLTALRRILLTLSVGVLAMLPQTVTSARASLACSETSTIRQAHAWISEQLDASQLIARGAQLSVPERDAGEQPYRYLEFKLGKQMDIQTVQQLGADYLVINTDLLTRDFTWQSQGIKSSPLPGQYHYEYLALRHWQEPTLPGTALITRFKKPELCPDYDIRIYEVGKPPELRSVALIAQYDFSKPSDRNLWQLFGQHHLSTSGERNYPTVQTARGLGFDTGAAIISSFRLVGPELGIAKDKVYRYSFTFETQTPQPIEAFANVEVFRRDRKDGAEGEFNAVSPLISAANASQTVSVLARSPERGATVVPSLVFNLAKPASVVVTSVTVDELELVK